MITYVEQSSFGVWETILKRKRKKLTNEPTTMQQNEKIEKGEKQQSPVGNDNLFECERQF